MRIDILTLFPDMCDAVLNESIIGRARRAGKVELNCIQIRDYSADKHRRTDDTPYGGGNGLIMTCQPIYDCFEDLCDEIGEKPHLIYMSPAGKTLTQERVKELSELENIAILCGHYEGVDQRVIDTIVDEEISIGDYVLTGGELGALVLADAVARLLPGVLSSDDCFTNESHYSGLLEHPQYTKPFVWNGKQVPEVLVSGHHANVDRFNREQSLLRTLERRPEMLENAELSASDREFLENIKRGLSCQNAQNKD